MSITLSHANTILNEFFRTPSVASNITTLYLGLSTTTVTSAGGGITEPSGNGYARVACTPNTTNWNVASNGILTNAVDFSFTEATGDWGTITDLFIASASTGTGSVILYYQPLTNSRSVQSGTTVIFPATYIQIKMDNT